MKKIALLSFFLLLMLTVQVPTAHDVSTTSDVPNIGNSLSSSGGGKVLVDESHTGNASEMWTPGNASMFGWILSEHGYNMSMNWNASLDSGILNDYDVLALFFPYIALTSGEVDAIHTFVENGGGLLLVGVEPLEGSWGYSIENLNPVSTTYGIEFDAERWRGRVLRSEGEIEDHQITTNVNSFHSNADQLSGCPLSISGSATSLATSDSGDTLAIAEDGSGRVVAIGALAPFTQYRKNVGWQVNDDDHSQLTVNIFDWLVGAEQRAVNLPEKAVIKVGHGPDLNETEIAQYEIFNGAYHDHTTASDGQNTPSEMAIRNVEVHQDFFVMSDHSYDKPSTNGIYGALAVREFTETYGLDSEIFIGAELSAIPHTVGFPLTEQIYTDSTQEAVNEIHAQGGIAVFCHPTIGFPYAAVWENFQDYGYDAFEVDNSGYIHGLGEQAYFWPFMGASDGHSAKKLGLTRNVAFVKNPSGPGGTITAEDLIDAVLDRRIVILDRYNNLVFGQGVWVDRFLSIQEEAETAVENAESEIEGLENGGYNVSLSRLYLDHAKSALDWWNPSRAIAYAEDATSEEVTGIDLEVSQSIGVAEPNSETTVSLSMGNRLETGVKLNVTPFVSTASSIEENWQSLAAAAGTTGTIDFGVQTDSYGYMEIAFNLKDFNTTEDLKPVTLLAGGIIDSVTSSIESTDEGLMLIVELPQDIGSKSLITSVSLTYSVDETENTVPMEYVGGKYSAEIGPYSDGTNVTIQVSVGDQLGNTFFLESKTITITGVTSPTSPGMFNPLVITAIAISGVAIIAVILVVMRKKGMM
ncbi:MAG: hypothetical protein GF309_14415 [Candidatus Lokiarchaeota archaeon]|nr:hypothetical protein [Candidatus Lokiarchaeota archaeon]